MEDGETPVPEVEQAAEAQEETSPFEGQFRDNRKNIEIPELGLTVNTIDIKPQKSSGKVPVFLAGGWLATHEKYEEAFRGIVDNGREAISIQFPRDEGKAPKGMSREEVKGRAVNAVLDQMAQRQVDLLSHSEGAIYAVEAALERPDRFKRVIFLAPTGSQGGEGLLSIAKKYINMVRSVKGTIKTAQKEGASDTVVKDGELTTTSKVNPEEIEGIAEGDKAISKATSEQLHKNRLLSLKEGLKMGSYDILPKLLELREKGVEVVFVQSATDEATPMEDTMEAIREFKREGGELPFDLLFTVRGSHSDLDGDRLRTIEGHDGSKSVVVDRVAPYVDEILEIFDVLDSERPSNTRDSELQRIQDRIDTDLFKVVDQPLRASKKR